MEPNFSHYADEKNQTESTYLPTPEQVALSADLRRLMDRLYRSQAMIEIHEQVTDFSQKLESKYGLEALRQCELWHILVFSSIDSRLALTRHDFPGEDSIALFVKQLADSELMDDKTSNTP